MGSSNSPRNRGPNVGVDLDLGAFTSRFFSALGSSVQFTGPGPCFVEWHSSSANPTERFAIDYLANELFTKYDDGKPSKEKRRKAVERFMEGERLSSLTNCKFSPNSAGQEPEWLLGPEEQPEGYSQEDAAVFRRARQLIGKVLGAFPGWDAVLQCANFGPGATTRLPRRLGHRSNKWSGKPHVTPFPSSPLEVVFDRLPLLKSRLTEPGYEIVLGNKLDWVSKNYKMDRTIAVEPEWNMFLQKGLGKLIRRKLKRVHQDLDDQSVNQFLAALGSVTGELATLDLSMASDTVAYRLVEYLVRPDWFEALEQCRSSVGFYSHEDQEHAVFFEKFSSMGNGYTFELESLIFWGILRAVSELAGESDHRLYVYGDDIVVPTGIATLAMTYLEKAGFVVNADKSFWQGPFRESCGGHYFSGSDVTPFYIREAVDSLDRLFLLHNNVWRWLSRHPGICTPEAARDLILWIRSHAPKHWVRPRLTRSDVGDGGFIGNFDEVRPTPATHVRDKETRRKLYVGLEGWRVQTLQYRDKRDFPQGVPLGVGKPSPDRDEEDPKKQYPAGSGPDLASLWEIESRIGGKLPSRGSELPHTERWWYLGTQVLPWSVESSWF